MNIESVTAKIGNVDLDEGSARLLYEVFASDNPAANWRTRLSSVEALLPVMPDLLAAYKDDMLVIEMTGNEPDKRGNIVETIEVRVNDLLGTIVNGILYSCQTAKVMSNSVTYRKEVENPSEGKRGRKAFAKVFTLPTKA